MLLPKEYEPVACALCGSSDTKMIAKKGQFGWPTYVSICKDCGLVFLNPRWTKENYSQFYATEYDQYYRFDENEAAEKELRKAKVVWSRLQQNTPRTFKSALDIGCGLGWLLDYIGRQNQGVSIAGIEPSDYCADHFVNKIGGELIARDVDSDWDTSNQGRFDLIVFRQVLEHLLDPLTVLTKVRRALAPEGALYVEVPDMMHPDGSPEDFWFRCVHAYYYSEATLQNLAARAGLKAAMIKSQDSELWAIFQKAELNGGFEVQRNSISVYGAQMRAFNRYKRQRFLRRVLLSLSPRKLSNLVPKSIKGLIPSGLKKKFRHLVYRH